MTRLRADCSTLSRWGEEIEAEIDRTQILAAEPEVERSFRTLTRKDVSEIIPSLTAHQWRQVVQDLKDKGELLVDAPFARLTLQQVHEVQETLGIRPRRPSNVPRALRVAVSSFKGGAGKSTLSLHLGTAMALRGYRVCVVDSDQQATLSRFLGFQPWRLSPEDTLAAAFGVHSDGRQHDSLPLTPRGTHIDGLDIVPGSLALSQVEIELLHLVRDRDTSFVRRFEHALRTIDQDYDIVLIDYQPSFSLTQLLLLHASDSVVVPMPTEAPDFAGTGDFLQQASTFITQLDDINSVPKFWDPFLVVHSRAKRRSNAVLNMAASVFREHRPNELIEDRQSISAALAAMKSVYEATDQDYDMRGLRQARQDYDHLTDVILEAIQDRWAEVVANGGSYD